MLRSLVVSIAFLTMIATILGSGFGADIAEPFPLATQTSPRPPPPAPALYLSGDAPGPTASSPAPPTGKSPTIAEWLNQTFRLRDTTQALDQPSPDGKPTARIRAGAEVKAIGIVAGERWVQIELADQILAYVPREAIEPNGKDMAQSPEPDRQRPEPATTATREGPGTTSAPTVVRGPVTRVPNAATLVIADLRIRLSGIDPGPLDFLTSFESWVRGQGALSCEPEARTGRYRCFTAGGVDVAEAAILNGAGRVGDGAPPAYRERETEARQGRRGLWQGS